MPEHILAMFSSRSFMIPGLKFKYLIHFEFIFVYGVRKWLSFILFHVAVQFLNITDWRGRLFLLYVLASFVIDQLPI